jgi:hypothetical protein
VPFRHVSTLIACVHPHSRRSLLVTSSFLTCGRAPRDWACDECTWSCSAWQGNRESPPSAAATAVHHLQRLRQTAKGLLCPFTCLPCMCGHHQLLRVNSWAGAQCMPRHRCCRGECCHGCVAPHAPQRCCSHDHTVWTSVRAYESATPPVPACMAPHALPCPICACLAVCGLHAYFLAQARCSAAFCLACRLASYWCLLLHLLRACGPFSRAAGEQPLVPVASLWCRAVLQPPWLGLWELCHA